MASADPSSLKGKKLSTSSSRSRNDSDSQWLLLPNNLELGARSKPTKKQRNKDKHKHFSKENLSSSSEKAEGLSCKPRAFQNFPQANCNTATWLKDHYMNDTCKRTPYDSEEICIETDLSNQQNINFPIDYSYQDMEHSQEHQMKPVCRPTTDNDNAKIVKDELKRKETALMYDILSLQEFISEAESSWQKLDLTDEPVIKDAFVKLKNAVKDVEGERESKLMLHQTAPENGFANGVSPSSSTSRVSNSKENVSIDTSGNVITGIDDEQGKSNHLQEIKASKERADSLSSDECAVTDVGQRVAAVEWERRKLKNKLVELQEEKKIKDELLRQLYFLKAACDSELRKTKDKKRKRLQSPSQQLKGLGKLTPTDDQNVAVDTSDINTSRGSSRDTRSSTSFKRDNVRKQSNSGFPARRHYEAEGRANEDPDIPAASAPPLSPTLDNPEIQDKIRKLKVAEQHVKVIKDIVLSILETRNSGNHNPLDLHLLTPSLQKGDQYLSLDESEDESNAEREYPTSSHLGNSEQAVTNVKEVCTESLKSNTHTLDIDSHKSETSEQTAAGNIETGISKKEKLAKLQSQFQHFMQTFPTDQRHDDPVRSSGEGAYTQKKILSRNVVPENVKKISSLKTVVPLQDNLQLTRQNIVTLESQNQNTNSNFHNRDCNSVKKDNINNLSGKMGKLSIQNTMNSSYPDVLSGSNNNVDSVSSFSYELNQNHILPNETERKTIFDILKRDKKKQKQYDRNQDNKISCNSSDDSETVEGTQGPMPGDTSIAAAWGGSSTLENFEDDERAESFEDQDDDDESAPVFDKVSITGRRTTSQYAGQFSNMQNYIDSVANISEKRQRNFYHPVYNASQNTQTPHNAYQHPAQVIKPTRRQTSASNSASGLSRDMQEPCISDSSDHCRQHTSSKFIQQLKNHIDQLDNLCQNQIFQTRPQATTNCPHAQNYNNLASICTGLPPTPDLSLPCNQQLLLYLSSVTIQCYHALYMQQLEIQQLQHCAWHNIEAENVHANNLNSRNNPEDLNFRPYCMPSGSNAFIPSTHFPTDQVSPLSAGSYFPLPMKPYPSHNSVSFPSTSSTQPARAVIYPTSQNNAAAQETLNNQVPPRTRANNFWDNFRSYSRQNLLSSTNNSKRNENVSSTVTPQVRQVHPLVMNEAPNHVSDVSNACCSSSFPEYNRSATNQSIQEVINISKKPRIYSVPPTAFSNSNTILKKDQPSGVNSSFGNARTARYYRPNTDSSTVQPINTSSLPLMQMPPPQDTSNVGSHSVTGIHSVPDSSIVNAASGVSGANSTEHQSEFLIGLFHEAQSLKSDVLRQKALKIIRDLAMSERNSNFEAKAQNDNQSTVKIKSEPSFMVNQSFSKQPPDIATPSDAIENEKSNSQISSDISSGNIQNLPTAAIPPLSKHSIPKTVSTGAVRKKPKSLGTSYSDSGPAHDTVGSTADNLDVSSSLSSNKIAEDIPGFVTLKVLSDFILMLPSLKRRFMRDSCPQTFWMFVNDWLIENLRNHLHFCNISLSRKSLFQLRQTVNLFLSLFSGVTLSEFDTDFLKYLEEFIYENITCFITNGHFAPVPSSLDEENCSMEVIDRQDSCLKLHMGPSDEMKELSIKMPVEESDTFPSQSRTSPVQSLLQSLLGYDNFVPEPSAKADCLGTSAEESGCRCNPEAEIEPEVEAGTEADLAEADQSPGQQGSVADVSSVVENWSEESVLIIRNNNMPRSSSVNNEENENVEDSSEGATGTQSFPDNCLAQETILDDIPTKLCPSEEVLPQKDDQPVQLHPDDTNSSNGFVSENNGGDGLGTMR